MKKKNFKSKALEKQADKLLKQDEQAQKLKEKGKGLDLNKLKKLF
jgi:hypothetical protein